MPKELTPMKLSKLKMMFLLEKVSEVLLFNARSLQEKNLNMHPDTIEVGKGVRAAIALINAELKKYPKQRR